MPTEAAPIRKSAGVDRRPPNSSSLMPRGQKDFQLPSRFITYSARAQHGSRPSPDPLALLIARKSSVQTGWGVLVCGCVCGDKQVTVRSKITNFSGSMAKLCARYGHCPGAAEALHRSRQSGRLKLLVFRSLCRSVTPGRSEACNRPLKAFVQNLNAFTCRIPNTSGCQAGAGHTQGCISRLSMEVLRA